MPQQQCIFCQLIDNPDQLYLVGETDNFYAWLEVNPRAKGHTQIVPKEHVESVLDFEPDEYHEAMRLVREVIEKAKKGLGAEGASVTMNIGEAAGQMMPHAYISVFPRFQEDENAGTPTGAIFPQQEELKSQIEDIQDSMDNVAVDFAEEKIEPHPDSQKFQKQQVAEPSQAPEPDEDEETQEEDEEENSSEEETESGNWDGRSYEWR